MNQYQPSNLWNHFRVPNKLNWKFYWSRQKLEFNHLFWDFLMVFFNFWRENPWQCQIKMCKTCFAVNRIRMKNFLVGLENYRAYDRNKFLPILNPKTIRLWKSNKNSLTVASSFFHVIVASFLGIFVPRLVLRITRAFMSWVKNRSITMVM